MLVSLVGLASAGDSTLLVTAEPNVGALALAVGDFDGDGVDDYAASHGDGTASSVWIELATGPIEIKMSQAVELMQLRAADQDGDGVDDLIVSSPNTGDGHGGIAVLSGIDASSDGLSVTEQASLTIQGSDEGGYFGIDFDLADLDGDGLMEILVAAPRENGARIYAGTLAGKQDSRAASGSFKLDGGSGMAVRFVGDLVVVGGCSTKDIQAETCADGGEIAWWDAGDWQESNSLGTAVGDASITTNLRRIEPLDGHDFVGISFGTAHVYELDDASDATADTSEYTTASGASRGAVHTDDLAESIYLIAGSVLTRLDPPWATGDATADAVDTWSLALDQVVSAGDHTGDGCADLVGVDSTDGSFYAIHGVCPPPDSGDTGDDSGDTGRDSGDSADDSGDSADDSGDTSDDSGDSAVDSERDTGGLTDSDPPPILCEPDFGWSCSGSTGGAAGALALLLGLGLVRRSRSGVRRRRE